MMPSPAYLADTYSLVELRDALARATGRAREVIVAALRIELDRLWKPVE